METGFAAPATQPEAPEPGDPHRAPAPVEVPAIAGPSRREAVVAAAVLLLLTLYCPLFEAPFNAPRLVVLALAGVVGTGPLLRAVARRDRAAMVAVAVVGWAGVSTALSSRPLLTLLGPPAWSTGWVFVWGLIGLWAAARTAGDAGRQLIGRLCLLGLGLNAGVAWLQAFAELPVRSLDPGGRSFGLAGNSAHLGTLMAAAFVATLSLTGGRINRGEGAGTAVRWMAWTALLGGALQASGSRGALVVATVGSVVVMVRRPKVAVLVAPAVVAAVVVSSFASVTGATSRLAGDGVGDAGRRASISGAAVEAAGARPLFGWGPMRFAEGTARTSGSVVVTGQLFTDAHNAPLTLAVGIGYVGTALVLAWLVLAGRRARGPWLAALAATIPSLFMQPMTITVYPAAFAALALATPRAPDPLDGRPPRRATIDRVAFAVAATAVTATGTVLLAGFALWRSGTTADDATRLAAAARLLPDWPEVALDQADAEIWLGLTATDPSEQEAHRVKAVAAARRAVRAEPTDLNALTTLAGLAVKWGDPVEARQTAETLLAQLPESIAARAVLADAAARLGDEDERAARCAEVQTMKPGYRVDSCVNTG